MSTEAFEERTTRGESRLTFHLVDLSEETVPDEERLNESLFHNLS